MTQRKNSSHSLLKIQLTQVCSTLILLTSLLLSQLLFRTSVTHFCTHFCSSLPFLTSFLRVPFLYSLSFLTSFPLFLFLTSVPRFLLPFLCLIKYSVPALEPEDVEISRWWKAHRYKIINIYICPTTHTHYHTIRHTLRHTIHHKYHTTHTSHRIHHTQHTTHNAQRTTHNTPPEIQFHSVVSLLFAVT
jgi:hypothetical protein